LAIVEFDKAIGRDPGFALAYAGLADSYLLAVPLVRRRIVRV
jgi:hypothetical protein